LYYFGCDKQLSEINTIDLQEYCRRLTKQGKSAARINSYISAFKAIYHWAIENELINNIPNLSAIKKLPRSKTSKPIFTPEEIRRLLNHAGYRMKATVWLGLNCGLGCTDCAELLWANVDLEAGRLNFPRTKTDVARYLPLLEERGASGYARFKDRLRLSSPDEFGEHTTTIKPPFRIWIDTFRPELDRKRWYHCFSALTATGGGFDLKRDVLIGHGPLGALYPTNTTHQQKEGDTMTFLYLVPTGMNDPEQPTWGSWAGRYGRNYNYKDKNYYWANQQDTWQSSTNRDNTLKRWAVHLQNDFRARLDWCVTDFAGANHPPVPRLRGPLHRTVAPGERVRLDAGSSMDVDGDNLAYAWIFYPEVGSYRGALPQLANPRSPQTSFVAPKADTAKTIHLLVAITDNGVPPLTRYRRVIVTIDPKTATVNDQKSSKMGAQINKSKPE
jgi:hypothetical protein